MRPTDKFDGKWRNKKTVEKRGRELASCGSPWFRFSETRRVTETPKAPTVAAYKEIFLSDSAFSSSIQFSLLGSSHRSRIFPRISTAKFDVDRKMTKKRENVLAAKSLFGERSSASNKIGDALIIPANIRLYRRIDRRVHSSRARFGFLRYSRRNYLRTLNFCRNNEIEMAGCG